MSYNLAPGVALGDAVRAINTAVQAVGRDRIMGIVLNRAQDALPYQSYSYYAYTSDQAPAEGKD